MSSQELFKETQKAAGAQQLTAWHKQLIEEGKAVKGYVSVSRIAPYLVVQILTLCARPWKALKITSNRWKRKTNESDFKWLPFMND